jgi:hypothetical protein
MHTTIREVTDLYTDLSIIIFIRSKMQNQQMTIRFQFVGKITKMGQRNLIAIPKNYLPLSSRLLGRSIKVTVEDIPLLEEETA